MTVLASIRPDDWNLPLFLHILGAMFLVGALVGAAYYLFLARRDGSLGTLYSGFRLLLYGALPAYLVMRVAAQWIVSEEGLEESEDAWIGIGFIVSDVGLLLLLIATATAGFTLRRARRSPTPSGSSRAATVAGWLSSILLVLYVVAIWAMTTKPI